MVYKRNSTSIELTNLVEEISRLELVDVLQKYHNKSLEKQAKSIVEGPSFLQFLNKLFQTSCYNSKSTADSILLDFSGGRVVSLIATFSKKSNEIYVPFIVLLY